VNGPFSGVLRADVRTPAVYGFAFETGVFVMDPLLEATVWRA